MTSQHISQGNTVIHSAPSQRDEAFTDVEPPQASSNGSAAVSGSSPRPESADSSNGKQPSTSEAWTENQELALVSTIPFLLTKIAECYVGSGPLRDTIMLKSEAANIALQIDIRHKGDS